jgi:hypothetical protein
MLRSYDESPSGIYMKVGYQNHSSFSEAFRNYFGSTPSDYQQHAFERCRRSSWPSIPNSLADCATVLLDHQINVAMMETMTEKNKAVVRRFNQEVIAEGNLESFKALIDEQFINRSAPEGMEQRCSMEWFTFLMKFFAPRCLIFMSQSTSRLPKAI